MKQKTNNGNNYPVSYDASKEVCKCCQKCRDPTTTLLELSCCHNLCVGCLTNRWEFSKINSKNPKGILCQFCWEQTVLRRKVISLLDNHLKQNQMTCNSRKQSISQKEVDNRQHNYFCHKCQWTAKDLLTLSCSHDLCATCVSQSWISQNPIKRRNKILVCQFCQTQQLLDESIVNQLQNTVRQKKTVEEPAIELTLEKGNYQDNLETCIKCNFILLEIGVYMYCRHNLCAHCAKKRLKQQKNKRESSSQIPNIQCEFCNTKTIVDPQYIQSIAKYPIQQIKVQKPKTLQVVNVINKKQRPQNKKKQESVNQLQCVVCMHKKRNSIYLPCHHVLCCFECGSKMKECPLCRKKMKLEMVYY